MTAESSGGAIQVTCGQRCAVRIGGRCNPVEERGWRSACVRQFGQYLAELGPGRDASSKAMEDSILSTNAGDITVLIPSNLRLTVQAINETGGGGADQLRFPAIRARMGGLRARVR